MVMRTFAQLYIQPRTGYWCRPQKDAVIDRTEEWGVHAGDPLSPDTGADFLVVGLEQVFPVLSSRRE